MEHCVFVTFIVIILCFSFTESLNRFKRSEDRYDTIVVGLGAAGVTAATTLARSGKRVLGLEAQDRVGGRVKTVPFGDGLIEEGGEWIMGEAGNRVYDTAKSQNIDIKPDSGELEVYRSDQSLLDQEFYKQVLDYCMEGFEDKIKNNLTIGQHLTQRLNNFLRDNYPDALNDSSFINDMLYFLNQIINSYEATNDWNDVVMNGTYEPVQGNQNMSWHKYGYKTFFEILLNIYKNGTGLPSLEIKLNPEVVKIIWSEDPEDVKVVCKDGATYRANNVIVTTSLGVLKERFNSLFSPQLPQDKVDAIKKIDFGYLGKIVLSFEKAWWPRKKAFGLFWKDEDRKSVNKEDSWVTILTQVSSPMGSDNTLTLWIYGDVVKEVEQLPLEVVKAKSIDTLRKFLDSNYTITNPTGIIRSTWYSNPFTRGAYSYDGAFVLEDPNARNTLARPLSDKQGNLRVLFAGEATHLTHFSTIHGGSDSGYREAMRLLS